MATSETEAAIPAVHSQAPVKKGGKLLLGTADRLHAKRQRLVRRHNSNMAKSMSTTDNDVIDAMTDVSTSLPMACLATL